MHKMKRFLRLPGKVKAMISEALYYAAKYRWLLLHKPFHAIAADLGSERTESDMEVSSAYHDTIRSVAWAINAVCNRTPWESMCLVRAFCAKRMLRKRGLPATVYMGVQKDKDGKLVAHAWTRCGAFFVTGGDGSETYTITNYFS